jgi:exonuclease SbcC
LQVGRSISNLKSPASDFRYPTSNFRHPTSNMHILSVELENVKSYDNATIHFAEGVNAIVGHNGAGKSTILEAIGFTLFDAIEYKQSDFVREGAKTATITVNFLSGLDERRYQVVRRVGGLNQQYIFDPETSSKLCSGSADVATFLRQHLGVDPAADLTRLFRDAVGAPQGTLTAAFLEQPARRKGTFDPLLQVEEYQQAFTGLLEAKNLLKERQRDADVQIAGLAAQVEKLPGLEQRVGETAAELKAVEQALASDRAQLTAAEAARAGQEQARQAVVAAENRHKQALQAAQAQTAQLQRAQRSLTEAESAAATVKQNQPAHDLYVAAQARKQQVDEQVRQRQKLQANHAATEKEAALAASRIDQRQRELESISEAERRVAALAPRVQEQAQIEQMLASAREQAARLQDTQRELTRQNRLLEQEQAKQKTIREQFGRVARLETELQARQMEISSLRLQMSELTEQQGAQQAEADALKKQNQELVRIEGAICPVCEQPLTPQHRDQTIARNEQRLTELRSRYASLKQERKTTDAAIAESESRLQAIQADLRKLPNANSLADVEKTIAEAVAAQAEIQKRVAVLADAPERITALEAQLTALGDPRKASNVASAEVAKRAGVEAALAEAQKALEQRQSELSQLNAQLVAFGDLDAQLDESNAQLARNAAGYQAVIANRQSAARREEHLADVLRLEEMLAGAQAELHNAEAQLATTTAAFDARTYEASVRAEQELRGRVGGLQARLDMLRRNWEQMRGDLAALKDKQAELASAQTKREGLARQERILDALRNTIKQAGPYITSALISQISEGAAQIFGDLMSDYTRRLQWNEDYGITLDVEGRQRGFAQLSGGEQMSAALAVRLSLLREMSAIDIAFFDEPTANLDATRRDALAQQILAVKGFRQLFVISHDDAFEQVTQKLIRVERVDGVSRVAGWRGEVVRGEG